MKPAIHYAFKSRFIKKKNENGEYEFIEDNREFFDDDPINARKAAFKHYLSYLDVLLVSKGSRYESDKQAYKVLESYFDPKTVSVLDNFGFKVSLPDSFGNGIGVYLVIDDEYDNIDYSRTIELIHGFGQPYEGSCKPESFTVTLERELEYYKHFKYNHDGQLTTITFCNSDEWIEGYRDDEPQTYTFLKTPFDWTGMDKPYWWGEEGKEDQEQNLETESQKTYTLESIIAEGESNQVEFKPSLLYNYKTKSAGIGIKGIIAKSICAFLNSNGGFLLIGVGDKGIPQGLSHDFSLSGDKEPHDFFKLEFDDMIKQFIPLFMKDNIFGEFHEVSGQEIFVVKVFPSKTKPIFMNGQYGKEFWVRWTASSRQFDDVEDLCLYILEHWGNKKN